MIKKPKVLTPEFKTKVTVAAIKALKTSSEIASQYEAWPRPDSRLEEVSR